MLIKKSVIFCAVLALIMLGSSNISAQSQNLDKVIILNLEFKNNILLFNGADLAYNFPPDEVAAEKDGLLIRKLSLGGRILEEYFIYDPRIVFIDQTDEKGVLIENGGSNVFKKDVVFDLISVYTKDVGIIEIYDQDKVRLTSVDLTNYIKHFCGVKDNICDQDCTDLIKDPDCKEEAEIKKISEVSNTSKKDIIIITFTFVFVFVLIAIIYVLKNNK